jgi:hypothetical protein
VTDPWADSGLEVLRSSDFSGPRLNRSGTVAVCFGAEWCPITRRFIPKFFARQAALGVPLAIADITDLNDPLWDTFRIRITPSVIVFRDGAMLLRMDGRRFLGITHADMNRLEAALRTAESETR